MHAKQVLYNGHVQGVGFRYTVKRIATGYDVIGWIRNLNDGRVELQASSHDEEELNAFIQDIQTSSLNGNIKEIEIHNIPPLTGVKNFTISE